MEKTCKCGCDGIPPVSKYTSKRDGTVKGRQVDYCLNHHTKKCGVPYEIVDCGYDTPCWIWQRGKTQGYGAISIDGISSRAHTKYWTEKNGPLADGLELDHLCHSRNPDCTGGECVHRACVNPDHLEAVTSAENNRRRKTTKLSIVKAEEIRSLYASGKKMQELATLYGVAHTGIWKIVNGQTWVQSSGA